jgi:hypothetical protein
VTVDDTNNRVDVDEADPSWSPTTAQALTRIGLFYDPDTTTGTDADLIPLFIDDFALTTATSGTLTYNVERERLLRGPRSRWRSSSSATWRDDPRVGDQQQRHEPDRRVGERGSRPR